MESRKINIQPKPDSVSWDAIKQCLVDAHSVNRDKGINMAHYQWPVEKIIESIGDDGTMLVAMDGDKVVGTAGLAVKNSNAWYTQGCYGYMCFASVLPEYKGLGIYKSLTEKREEIAKGKGLKLLLLDTHAKNQRIQTIAKANGYQYVNFIQAKSRDHFSVIMVKWFDGCPYSRFYCRWKFLKSKLRASVAAKLQRR